MPKIMPKDERTNNFYTNVIHKVFNYMRQLTLTGADRDPLLSGFEPKDIILDSINFHAEHLPPHQLIYISNDASQSVENVGEIISEVVEDMRIRIEIYLGSSSGQEDLTITKTGVMKDMRYLLSRNNYYGPVEECDDDGVMTEPARISESRILTYGPHPDTINTGQELLVYLFQVRLHHFEKDFTHRDVSVE